MTTVRIEIEVLDWADDSALLASVFYALPKHELLKALRGGEQTVNVRLARQEDTVRLVFTVT